MNTGDTIDTRKDSNGMIMEMLVQIIHKAAYIDNQPVNLGDGHSLSAAEIHLIDCIGHYPDDTITGIASRIGVTKGAVSQMVSKLELKGYLSRRFLEGNRKSIILTLTDQGKKAFLWHITLHDRINSLMLDGMSDMSSADRERFLTLLTNLSLTLDHSLEVRSSHTKEFLERYG